MTDKIMAEIISLYFEQLVSEGLMEKSIDEKTGEPAYSTTLKGRKQGLFQDKTYKNKYSKI